MLPTVPSGRLRPVPVLFVTSGQWLVIGCGETAASPGAFGFRVADENDLGYKHRLLKLRGKRGEMSWPRFVK